MEIEIMKCLLSKGYFCSLSDRLYPVQDHSGCVLALYFNNDESIKTIAQFQSVMSPTI